MDHCRTWIIGLVLGCSASLFAETNTPVVGPQIPKEKVTEKGANNEDRFTEWVIKGFDFESEKKYPEAIRAFTEALAIQEESTVALIRRGICYARINENDKASADLHAAISSQPHTVTDFFSLAWLRATSPIPRFRDGTLAVAYAERALKNGEAIERYDALAAGYAEMGNFRLAIDMAQKGIKFFPDSPRVSSMQKRLQLYKEKKKYREDWDKTSPRP